MSHKKVKIREDKASDVMKMDPYKFKLKHAQKAKKKYLYTVSIRSLILLTALAVIFVLLTAITVTATVTRPWVRVDVETSTACECAKIGDANNSGGNEIVAGGTSVIYMYVWDGDTWSRTTIGTPTGTVNDIVIANVDNVGSDNKIAAALSTNTIYMYEWSESAWDLSIVSTAVDDDDPSAEVLDMSVGDADDQGGNKIVASTDDGAVVMFKWNTISSAWDRTEIVDYTKAVYNVEVADCDNDGETEVTIVGDKDEIDTYCYNGGWAKKSDVGSISGSLILNLDVGDADNTGGNKILVCTSKNDIYMYKWSAPSWQRTDVSTGTGADINDIKIGDVYNEGDNSVVSGGSAQNVIIYTYDSGSWPSSTVDDAAGGSVLEVTSGDADNDGKNEIVAISGGNILLYEIITWASYRESGHSTPWGTVADPYSSTYHIVYMSGEGFKTDHDYKVAYYDGSDEKVQLEFTNTSIGTALTSQYDFTKNSGAVFGDWHSVVLDTIGSAPQTYAVAIADPNYVTDDGFEVAESAIPEFPTVIAAIAVCLLCAVAYVVMRRNGGKR